MNEKTIIRGKNNEIIETDEVGYNKYLKQKNKVLSKEQRLNNLENELSEIKQLLLQLVNK